MFKVVLTVCLVLGHTGRFARSASCVYGGQGAGAKNLEICLIVLGPDASTSVQPQRSIEQRVVAVLTVCLVLGHMRRPAGGASCVLGVSV